MASSWPATAYMLQRKDSPALLRAPLVHDIARKLGKKPSQVLLNWAVAHGTTVSPKAGSLEHVQVNGSLLSCILLLCNASTTQSYKLTRFAEVVGRWAIALHLIVAYSA